MNHQIEVGLQQIEGGKTKKIFFDLTRLILTRLLICANSGGGKSWLIRRATDQKTNQHEFN